MVAALLFRNGYPPEAQAIPTVSPPLVALAALAALVAPPVVTWCVTGITGITGLVYSSRSIAVPSLCEHLSRNGLERQNQWLEHIWKIIVEVSWKSWMSWASSPVSMAWWETLPTKCLVSWASYGLNMITLSHHPVGKFHCEPPLPIHPLRLQASRGFAAVSVYYHLVAEGFFVPLFLVLCKGYVGGYAPKNPYMMGVSEIGWSIFAWCLGIQFQEISISLQFADGQVGGRFHHSTKVMLINFRSLQNMFPIPRQHAHT